MYLFTSKRCHTTFGNLLTGISSIEVQIYPKNVKNQREISIKDHKSKQQQVYILTLIIIEMKGRANPLYQLAINSINLAKEYTRTQTLVSQC